MIQSMKSIIGIVEIIDERIDTMNEAVISISVSIEEITANTEEISDSAMAFLDTCY